MRIRLQTILSPLGKSVSILDASCLAPGQVLDKIRVLSDLVAEIIERIETERKDITAAYDKGRKKAAVEAPREKAWVLI
jgi:hypothetical protein